MHRLLFLNVLPTRWRIPAKLAILLATVFFVCFPNPSLFVEHVRRWRNPNQLVDPHSPALDPLAVEVQAQIPPDAAPADVLKTVEKYVLKRVAYEWDWNNWGNADFIPTVAETLQKGKEDCDGRAVVAASLLTRIGYPAQIVTDFSHVWVTTEYGDLMGPGQTQAIVATGEGLKIKSSAWKPLAKALAYCVAPFPLPRELIILAVLWWLLLRIGIGAGWSLVALAFMLNGLLFMRVGGENYWKPVVWMQLVGLTNLIGGIFCLFLRSRQNSGAVRSE